MQFDEAVNAARRLAAKGEGAEDWVIMSAIADKLADLEVALHALAKECHLDRDGVHILSESMRTHIRTLRNRLCQSEGIQDAFEKQLHSLKRMMPPKKSRKEPQEKPAPDTRERL